MNVMCPNNHIIIITLLLLLLLEIILVITVIITVKYCIIMIQRLSWSNTKVAYILSGVWKKISDI